MAQADYLQVFCPICSERIEIRERFFVCQQCLDSIEQIKADAELGKRLRQLIANHRKGWKAMGLETSDDDSEMLVKLAQKRAASRAILRGLAGVIYRQQS